MKRERFETIESYMKNCAGDSAHDQQHIYRVLHHALNIAKTEQDVDYDVLITACLLHDIGRPEQFADPTLCHAVVGSEKAARFLEALGLQQDFIEKVCHCIRTHRFSNRRPPESLEAKILFDADKLDVVGALGIARTLQYQGKHDFPLYELQADGSIELEQGKSFFQEYHRKLTKLYDGFLTREGHRLAQKEQVAAQAFYHALYQQIDLGDNDLSAWIE